MNFTRRLGLDPHASGNACASLDNCPDILELADGDFAIIGFDITDAAKGQLAFGAKCGEGERVVKIPRHTLVLAKRDIPESV